MAAAQRAGLVWPTVCEGQCECGTCWVVVVDGDRHCSPASAAERARLALGMKANHPAARLGCQLRVEGPVTLERRAVRRAEVTDGHRDGPVPVRSRRRNA